MDILEVVKFPYWEYVLSAVVVVLGIHFYLTRNFNYWTSRGIKCKKPRFYLDGIQTLFKKPVHLIERERYETYGRLHGAIEFSKALINVADPELLKNILVKDFHIFTNRRDVKIGEPILENGVFALKDEQWKRVRNIISPTFSTSKMKQMSSLIQECAISLKDALIEAATKGDIIDCKDPYGAYSMDVIASCHFGVKTNSHLNPDNPFLINARKLSKNTFNFRVLAFLFLPTWLLRLLKISIIPPEIIEFFRNGCMEIINSRKQNNLRGNDFLQLMLDVQEGIFEEDSEATTSHSSKKMSEDEILSQCITFLLGGHDTTATTLAFSTYLLAMNPECQEKLIAEVDEIWKKTDGKLDFDDVMKMPYLDAVINETQRLFPLALRLERVPNEDYVLGNTGIVIPKEMIVVIPIMGMHYDPEWFPDPDKFDPERFSPENKNSIIPYTYLPFGSGPRNCVGLRFAVMTLKYCLVYLLHYMRFVATEETKKPLEFSFAQGLSPKKVLVKLQLRENEL